MTNASPAASVPMAGALPAGNAALVVGHPGHELRVHHWVERARPRVFVLTDGSGGAGEARIASTAALLERTGASSGAVFGRLSDREIYAAFLDRRIELFTGLATELAGALAEHDAGYVVCDAEEGYNPTHDLCRMLVDAAVRMAARQLGRPLPLYDFVLVAAPDACPDALRDRAIWLRLGPEALDRKLAAARRYAELRGEVEAALERYGVAPFTTECLRPATAPRHPGAPAPYYETYGEQQVAAGVYRQVLRYGEHVLPVAERLWELADAHG